MCLRRDVFQNTSLFFTRTSRKDFKPRLFYIKNRPLWKKVKQIFFANYLITLKLWREYQIREFLKRMINVRRQLKIITSVFAILIIFARQTANLKPQTATHIIKGNSKLNNGGISDFNRLIWLF